MRARMAMQIAGFLEKNEFEIVEISLKDKPSDMLSISPKGTVPVLKIVHENGKVEVIDESLDIIEFAMKNTPKAWPKSDLDQKLIAENDGEFKKWLDKYKYHSRHPEFSKEHYYEKASKFLLKLENQLKDHKHLTQEEPSMADFAIFPFIRQFHFCDETKLPADFPKLHNWLNGFLESKIFQKIMQKKQQQN